MSDTVDNTEREAAAHLAAAERHKAKARDHEQAAAILKPEPARRAAPENPEREKRRRASHTSYRNSLAIDIATSRRDLESVKRLAARGHDPIFNGERVERAERRLADAIATLAAWDRKHPGYAPS